MTRTDDATTLKHFVRCGMPSPLLHLDQLTNYEVGTQHTKAQLRGRGGRVSVLAAKRSTTEYSLAVSSVWSQGAFTATAFKSLDPAGRIVPR